jgi:dephospho-CoA kinase
MIVGLTGGIGSGKTTISKIFIFLGIPVFYADEQAKQLLEKDEFLKAQLVELIGPKLLLHGKIDKPYMASRIFSDPKLLKAVNALIHPAVALAFENWYAAQKSSYVLREAAILFESGSHKDCDHIVVVSASENTRIKRVMTRSSESLEQVKNRMNKQWPQEEKNKLADSIIYNDATDPVIPQVLKIHKKLLAAAKGIKRV